MIKMLKFYFLPTLSVIGLLLVIRTVILSGVPQNIQPALVDPPHSPYQNFVAGSGIVEAFSENISIGNPLPGVVRKVYVRVGDYVEAGAALFGIDDRDLHAEKLVREAELAQAKVLLAVAEKQYSLYQTLSDKRAVSQDLFITRQFAVSSARTGVQVAEARLVATATTLERMIVRAPIRGQVLSVKIRAGEYAPGQVLATPLILLGDTSKLAVRVDIDENDAWRVKAGTSAKAVLRGNAEIGTQIKFERFEPYVIPKRSLSGESSERVDTRVLQAVYSFETAQMPVFVGQLVDVFIEVG